MNRNKLNKIILILWRNSLALLRNDDYESFHVWADWPLVKGGGLRNAIFKRLINFVHLEDELDQAEIN